MRKKIKVKTPAKINLSLEITDKLPNDFHQLSTIMQTVSLYDYLTIDIENTNSDNKIILTGNSKDIPYDNKNIVYKVLDLYLSESDIKKEVTISVNFEKNIPTQAGLAGGSANAAGALIAVNELFDNALPKETLHKIAAKAGSDLNFCLEGGACLLSSRGEIIEEKLPYKDFNVVIVKPKHIAVSTPQCYKNFSAKYFEKKEAVYSKKIVNLFKNEFSINALTNYLYNDLEKPAIDMFPEIQDIKNKLIKAGCINALMSGSGSSVFGIYENDIDLCLDENYSIYKATSLKNSTVELI